MRMKALDSGFGSRSRKPGGSAVKELSRRQEAAGTMRLADLGFRISHLGFFDVMQGVCSNVSQCSMSKDR